MTAGTSNVPLHSNCMHIGHRELWWLCARKIKYIWQKNGYSVEPSALLKIQLLMLFAAAKPDQMGISLGHLPADD